MRVIGDELNLDTRGFSDMHDITPEVSRRIRDLGLSDGTVTLFVPGSTGGLTTIEFEPALTRDFQELMESLAPSTKTHHHDATWGDGNGFSHLRASLIGPSLVVPFSNGSLALGTWQQIVFIDFDNRPRSRRITLQFMGE